jgi:hypothetical protein
MKTMMEKGKAAVISFKDEFVEGTILAMAINDEQRRIYKIDSPAFPKDAMWIASDRVYEIKE